VTARAGVYGALVQGAIGRISIDQRGFEALARTDVSGIKEPACRAEAAISVALARRVLEVQALARQAIAMLNEWDESMASYQQGTSDGTTAKELAQRLDELLPPSPAPVEGRNDEQV
jgi:hypothetical protein